MFSPVTQTWFDASFPGPTEVQRRGWEVIGRRGHALLVAPTGSGKTLAAFLAAIDALAAREPIGRSRTDSKPVRKSDRSPAAREPGSARGTRVLYVSPLKALVYDIERNLRSPLVGIRRTAERLGLPPPEIRVSVRTGDTPQRERQRHARDPGDILVTTPESLFLILGSAARATLRTVETIIIDEVHALAPTKRGVHLALSLERLCELTERDPQRIGLSATVRPLEEAARYLGGDRPVEIVDATVRPNVDLRVIVPVPDMTNVQIPDIRVTAAPGAAAAARSPSAQAATRFQDISVNRTPAPASAERDHEERAAIDRALLDHEPADREPADREPIDRGGPILAELYERKVHTPPGERGIWPAIYPEILEEIQSSRSTIIFVNSRGLCERLAQRLNDMAGTELVRAHHGSVSHEKRREMEEALKGGTLRGIVATSSLELGIDMGAVDRVILVESPGSVARGLQRVGRAGHQVGEVSVGRMYPKYRGDLLESAVLSARMLQGEIESSYVPQNNLDVLAQQVVAIVCDRDRTVEEIAALVHRSYSYRELSAGALEAVLDMLSGRYPSADFADLRPLLSWDRTTNTLSTRRGAQLLSRMNPGTIPDRGHFPVHLGEKGPRVGELDEEMVFESRVGDNILLGATTWRVEAVQRDRVIVSPAPGEPGRLPFWKGDGPGRPIEVGRALGAFLRELANVPYEKAAEWIQETAPLDRFAAQNLADYVHEQMEETGALPTDRSISIERFRDELGDWRICILTPFGARVHAPWAMAIQRRLSRASGFQPQLMYAEAGIVLRFAETEELPDLDTLIPAPEEVEDLITDQLPETAMFAGLFRENAVRSLLLPRRRPTQRNPLWAQRIKAQQLLASVRRYPSFPVVLETYRQALRDVFDVPALREILADIRMRHVQVREVETNSASPFARSLVFSYVAAYMYEQDAPLAERRAQALTVDRKLLNELLGQAELRELIDPQALAELEEELQHTRADRRARDPDELHDLLRRLGDLSLAEIGERTVDRSSAEPDPALEVVFVAGPWLEQLHESRRAIEVTLGGERRWIAAEDAGLYRDALGVMTSTSLPSSFLDPTERALEQIVGRYSRHHGPFLAAELARRYLLRAAQVEPILRQMVEEGTLVHGEIRPGGIEPEYCDAEVLRRLKRMTLARLRHEIAAVDGRALARFLPEWQGIGSKERGPERLLEAIAQLEGLALPWSELCDVLLPQRVAGFQPDQLDVLSATGAIAWVGRGPLGPRDGRVALYLRAHAGELLEPQDEEPPLSELHVSILGFLRGRGASFQSEIEQALHRDHPGLTHEEFEGALWDLVWTGRITNDTFGPLQEVRWPARRFPRRRDRLFAARAGRWWRVEDLSSSTNVSPASASPAITQPLAHSSNTHSPGTRGPGSAGGGHSPVAPSTDTHTPSVAAPDSARTEDRTAANETHRALARARLLLERYGIVSREAAHGEDLPGGFAPLYRVFQAMEESGQIRRGYFVDGMAGVQFAHAGAVERLRAARPDDDDAASWREADVVILAAVDPANPYGVLLPWPESENPETVRPRRVAGADVFLLGGHPVLYLGPRGRQLLIFPHPALATRDALAIALPALRRVPSRSGRRRLQIEEISGVSAGESPYLDLMQRAGFERSYRGLVDVKV